MESEIILKGFLEFEAQHRLKYVNYIGERDSSALVCWENDIML